jgi:hypothetical protein
MAGSWSQLSGPAAPPAPIGTMLLLTDGSVMAQQTDFTGASADWYALTPDPAASYEGGLWTQLASLPADAPPKQGGPAYAPLYYASAVLRDGRVFLAGGEYNGPTADADVLAAHVYDPAADEWDSIATPPGWNVIGDAASCVLADGRVLLGSIEFAPGPSGGKTALYDPAADTWTAGGLKNNRSSSEETWTLLRDGSVLTADCFGDPAVERYDPAQNVWLPQAPTTVSLVEPHSQEIGPAILLPDGRVFAVGAQNGTQLFTPPPAGAGKGVWHPGPPFPPHVPGETLGAKDAPACLLPNGRVLCAVGPVDGGVVHPDGSTNYLKPTRFYEFDPVASTMTFVAPPGNADEAPFVSRMLLLPTGQVLFANCTTALWIYTPDGEPRPAWRPVITGVPATLTAGARFVVRGRGFNGLSQAVSYGDDAQMATNYPLVALATETSGLQFYCRTWGHSTMAVATGAAAVRTNFELPVNAELGPAQLTVIANGIASEPVDVTVVAP